ncbi:unnamed protein product [Lactuca saligna]|uniref:Uncharacterized protein n=1 Tax=Lactuca saligna TaxID=75948 RepID=A0AA35ZWA2_LACSI|nr:unnamed protein product [Lactuca saligna]
MPMASLANSAMEAASRWLASNDCSTRFTAGRHSFPSIVRVKRRNNVTHAAGTEPKPKAANPLTYRIVDESSINTLPPYINIFSCFQFLHRMETVSQEIKRVRAQIEENEQLAI